MYTLEELKPMIIEWAKAKDLIKPENADKQRLKLIEECGELAGAILKNDIAKQKDGIGDIFVVLTILESQMGILFDWSKKDLIVGVGMVMIDIMQYPPLKCNELYNIARNLNHDITECANLAWNEIKDRKGKTVSGTFIKESECTENHILGHA